MNLLDRHRELALEAAGYPSKKRKTPPRTLRDLKMAVILETLDTFGGHRRKAAQRLGISESTLYLYLKQNKRLRKSE